MAITDYYIERVSFAAQHLLKCRAVWYTVMKRDSAYDGTRTNRVIEICTSIDEAEHAVRRAVAAEEIRQEAR